MGGGLVKAERQAPVVIAFGSFPVGVVVVVGSAFGSFYVFPLPIMTAPHVALVASSSTQHAAAAAAAHLGDNPMRTTTRPKATARAPLRVVSRGMVLRLWPYFAVSSEAVAACLGAADDPRPRSNRLHRYRLPPSDERVPRVCPYE
jgi:hypothetical protein